VAVVLKGFFIWIILLLAKELGISDFGEEGRRHLVRSCNGFYFNVRRSEKTSPVTFDFAVGGGPPV
jgi:hypothetical protein